MAYDVILIDIDNTLLDFNAGTAVSLRQLLGDFGLELTEERLQQFFTINNSLWTAYEHGEIEKSFIFPTRFQRWLGDMGITTDWLAANERYAEGLRQSAVLMPRAMELLDALKGNYPLYAVTNGVVTTQKPRLQKSRLDQYFDQVFISEAMGCKKPEKEFFDKVFDAIGNPDKRRCIILGDSLSSDMQGGRNAGIATCFFGEDPKDDRCDYVIGDLMEFLDVLEQ